jgi:ATP-binding cassette subfamily B protein
VLKNISLSVPAGGSLGVVGPTGSGKSTLAMLLAHLYRVDRGQIFLDGHDINDIPPGKLRDSVSLVLQETFLFSDTIGRNIGFGAEAATQAAIRAAAQRARIAAEIEALPRDYDTMLGERGINLSGGQKQRVAIARAIIRDPRILILDDALSAVDTQTEAAIIESLREVLAARTAIVIAHRISAVMHCDTIIVLEDGRITEQGTHDSLVAAGGLYATLYEKQLLAEAVEAEAD